MSIIEKNPNTDHFLKSLGFPSVEVHHAFTHFDFTKPSRRILVIGPMGSGKTEFSARVWRDARVALGKSSTVKQLTSTGRADRRKVFFIRSLLDVNRFQEYPDDALAYRGGYERCGTQIARISDSFSLEEILRDNPATGTWIIDEASFYDERLVYVVRNASEQRGLLFIFPTLILNFRRDIFNPTARLMLETATDVIPLTAYCEHPDCLEDSFYTYRYYQIDGKECPALYFDPLIVVGGDKKKEDSLEPNYCTRCDRHHYLPGKEYTFFTLKPLGEEAAGGSTEALKKELYALNYDIESSELSRHLHERYKGEEEQQVCLNSLNISNIAERALMYLYGEQNLIPEELLVRFVNELKLDRDYLKKTLEDNRRTVNLDQPMLF
ncbi:MAG: thymidine kinase [Spirochaetales bacterium]|nr:thymidine kinase [Spirochaetales bacterium]